MTVLGGDPSQRARAVLVAWAVFCVAALAVIVDLPAGASRLTLDPSIGGLLPEDDPELLFHQEAIGEWGAEGLLVVALTAADVSTPRRLERIGALGEALEALPFVHSVRSIATVTEPVVEDGRVALRRVIAGGADSLGDHPLYGGALVSRDDRAAALLVKLEPVGDPEFMEQRLDARVAAVVDAAWSDAPDEQWMLSGTPIIKAETSRLLIHDLATRMPPAILAGLALFLLAFGSWRATVVLAAGLVASLLAVGAAMVATGHVVDLNTSSVPVVVMSLCAAYQVHVVAEMRRQRRRNPELTGPALAAAVLERVRRPTVLAAATTACGLATLGVHPTPAIREFGAYVAVGAVVAGVASLSMLPSAIGAGFLGSPSRGGPDGPPGHADPEVGLAAALGAMLVRRRRVVLGVWAMLLLAAGLGSTRLHVGMDFVDNFRDGHPVRADAHAVADLFGGSAALLVVVDGGSRGAFLDPNTLQTLRGLDLWLRGVPGVGEVVSPLPLGVALYRAWRTTEDGAGGGPPSAEEIEHLLSIGGDEELDPFADPRRRRLAMLVRARATSSSAITALVAKVRRRLATLPEPLHGRVTGEAVLIARTIDGIAEGQVRSLGLAFVVVGILLAASLRSLRAAAVAVAPNLAAVGLLLGGMGAAGVALNSSTALLACLVFGVAVDDTVHIVDRYRRRRQAGDTDAEAVVAALAIVGRPVTTTTAIFVVSFAVLATSGLHQLADFGAVGALAMLGAWALDLTLTPALCAFLPVPEVPAPTR